MTPHDRDDDGDLLIGCRRMAEFAAAEGYPLATSTMQKRVSPAISTGPEIIGYYGQRPATDKGRMRAWLRANLRPDRPLTRRRKLPAIATTQPAEGA